MADWTIRDTEFTGVAEATLRFSALGEFSMQNCKLAKGPRYAIWEWFCDEAKTALPAIDMTNNDWGTTNPDSVASWIYSCDYEIDFIPIIDPTPVVTNTHGGLRKMFR